MTIPAAAQPSNFDASLGDQRELVRVEAAVDRALQYLAEHQLDDGSWPHGVNSRGPNNGISGACLLAFMGRGHAPGRGPYSQVVQRGIARLMSLQDDRGVYVSPGGSHGKDSMYEHALATLAMIEAYGFLPTPEVRRSAQRAVDLIVKAQNKTGGWRYQPTSNDADLSVTVMQMVALRSAMNARLNVPDKTIDNALTYIRKCAHDKGGFGYQPGHGSNHAMSAAGALSLQLMGHFDDPLVERAFEYIDKHTKDYSERITNHFYYMNYYAMQAHFQAGGQRWAQWHPKVRDYLLATQHRNGSWPGHDEKRFNGNDASCYSTAMAAISLEVYMHYLPAYQR